MFVPVVILILVSTVRGDDIPECLHHIAHKYLRSRCLSFLFLMKFRQPSLVHVPSVVRSPLLKNLHEDWQVYLPAVHRYSMNNPFLRLGPTCYLNCAHIIALNGNVPYVKQMDRILYTFYSHFYEDGGGNKTRIVITVSGETNRTIVYELLRYMLRMGEIDVVFVGKRDGVINVFTLFPFGRDNNSCTVDNTDVVIIDRWVDGRFEKNVDLFPKKFPRKFNNCTTEIGTMHDPPHVMLDDKGNGIGGIEYRIIETIGSHLGLRIRYKFYSRNDTVLWTKKERPRGIRTDLRMGRVWMIVSGHSNYIFSFSCITVAHTYLLNRISWFFSNPKQVPNWKLIILAFDRPLWILVLFTTVAFPSLLTILANSFKTNNPFRRLSTSMMVMLGLLFANPTSVKLKGALFRTAFAAWLFYVIHVNLAYSAALSSLLITGKQEPKITSFKKILELGLNTVMTENTVIQTTDVDEPLIKEVLSHRIIVQDVSEIYSYHKVGNFTLLEREPTFLYKIRKYDLSFYKSDLSLGLVFLGPKMRRNHFFIGRIADLSSRILESGCVDKFIQEYWRDTKSCVKNSFQAFNLEDLAGPFLILLIGSFLSFLVFLWEILYEHLCNRSELKT